MLASAHIHLRFVNLVEMDHVRTWWLLELKLVVAQGFVQLQL